MALLEWLALRAVRQATRRGGGDVADITARANILASSLDDEHRAADEAPPPTAGWRYQHGAWLRWSELEGEYRTAPLPISLVTYGNSLGSPREGMTVAMVDGVWTEVADGAAPLRQRPSAHPSPPDPAGAPVGAAPPPVPSVASAAERSSPGDQPTATAEPSMQEQLAAWRRRNGFDEV